MNVLDVFRHLPRTTERRHAERECLIRTRLGIERRERPIPGTGFVYGMIGGAALWSADHRADLLPDRLHRAGRLLVATLSDPGLDVGRLLRGPESTRLGRDVGGPAMKGARRAWSALSLVDLVVRELRSDPHYALNDETVDAIEHAYFVAGRELLRKGAGGTGIELERRVAHLRALHKKYEGEDWLQRQLATIEEGSH
jgi:hypothetical protein